jgi:uncharacterized Zn finger protein
VSAGVDLESIGYELRLGRVARENVDTKARRYLLEGRLQVRYCGPEGVRAFVRGQGELYHVTFTPGSSWHCSCAAKGRCCHLVATQLVVTVALPQGPT